MTFPYCQLWIGTELSLNFGYKVPSMSRKNWNTALPLPHVTLSPAAGQKLGHRRPLQSSTTHQDFS